MLYSYFFRKLVKATLLVECHHTQEMVRLQGCVDVEASFAPLPGERYFVSALSFRVR